MVSCMLFVLIQWLYVWQAAASRSTAEAECSVQQLKDLLAAHEEELRIAQQATQEAQLKATMCQAAAQKKQAELHAVHSQELMRLHETHSADLRRLSAIQAEASQISHLLESSTELARHPQDMSIEEIGEHCATCILLCTTNIQTTTRRVYPSLQPICINAYSMAQAVQGCFVYTLFMHHLPAQYKANGIPTACKSVSLVIM